MAAENNAAQQAAKRVPGKPFKPGQSGNPGGRPKALKGVEELARSYTAEAMRTLAQVMRSKKSPEVARVAASNALLDRGWGKPKQTQEIELRADLASVLDEIRAAAAGPLIEGESEPTRYDA